MEITITKKKILAVEGKDEIGFFYGFLEYLKIKDVQVLSVGGKDEFKKKLPALIRIHNFSDVEMLAVIRDADDLATGAFQSIKNILEKRVSGDTIKVPEKENTFSTGNPKVGIYIMPGNSEKGMLEDLCLNTVKDHPAMKCVNSFMNCILKLDNPPNNLAKAKVQAFLAAMPKIANCISIGVKKVIGILDQKS
ncbi:MAG: hypothetical protein KAX49_15150 [Halanaerobiales bacterium]|nr:hypothetical protein [Halanaerobiales bacterium]